MVMVVMSDGNDEWVMVMMSDGSDGDGEWWDGSDEWW